MRSYRIDLCRGSNCKNCTATCPSQEAIPSQALPVHRDLESEERKARLENRPLPEDPRKRLQRLSGPSAERRKQLRKKRRK